MSDEITIPQRIRELCAEHGGLRPAAQAVGVDVAYMYRLHAGMKRNPSNDVLHRLGLVRRVTYARAPAPEE